MMQRWTLTQQGLRTRLLPHLSTSSLPNSHSSPPALSSCSDLSAGLLSDMERGDEACRLDSAAGRKKKPSAPFIVTSMCVYVCVQYVTAHHCPAVWMCVCYVCVRLAKVYLFILAHCHVRKAEGTEEASETGSISGFVCVLV